jgi:hypothetical protein
MDNETDTRALRDAFSAVFDGEPLRGAILSRNAEQLYRFR